LLRRSAGVVSQLGWPPRPRVAGSCCVACRPTRPVSHPVPHWRGATTRHRLPLILCPQPTGRHLPRGTPGRRTRTSHRPRRWCTPRRPHGSRLESRRVRSLTASQRGTGARPTEAESSPPHRRHPLLDHPRRREHLSLFVSLFVRRDPARRPVAGSAAHDDQWPSNGP